jgi:two-component system, NtrC family, nitrogen regulation sensor histidine kinase NtrY
MVSERSEMTVEQRDRTLVLKRSSDSSTIRRKLHLSHERRVFLMALVGGLPGAVVSLVLLWSVDFQVEIRLTLSLLIVCCWLCFALALRRRVVSPLQTLSNLLAALREGDFSIRAHGASRVDALGDVLTEVNSLGEILQTQRIGAIEATALLRTVMTEIEVVVFAFDREERVVLVNRAGERLMARPAERLVGCSAAQLNLSECLHGEEKVRTLQMSFPGGEGRWEMHRNSFRNHGEPHQLLVLTDLSRALREEERQAWQRLVRVLGHELNNSLAPIKSIAGSLETLLLREPQPPDWHEDMQRGLSVISSRAASLSRFMSAYALLTRLPQPSLAPLDLHVLIRRVIGLETRLSVTLIAGPELTIEADGDQLEQVLINLLRNAVDAALETGGGVSMGWKRGPAELEIWIEDEGHGLANTANLFVPFFTTKPNGSGIGLTLSRQIAEAHGGTLTLENRSEGRGCKARLHLPL